MKTIHRLNLILHVLQEKCLQDSHYWKMKNVDLTNIKTEWADEFFEKKGFEYLL